jgi:hypothetical protein
MRTRSKLLPFGAAALALAAGGGLAAVAASDDSSSMGPAQTVTATEENSGSPGPAPKRASTFDPAVERAFHRLGSARTPDDALPNADRVSALLARVGGNPNASRLLRVTRSDRYFLVPGQGNVCIVAGTGLTGCLPNEEAAGGQFIGTVECSTPQGDIRIYGVVPDGVEEVALVARTGSRDAAAVESNMYEFVVPDSPAWGLPDMVTWDGAQGTQSREVPLSPDVEQGC